LIALRIPITVYKKISVPLFIFTLILLAMVFLPYPIGVYAGGAIVG